MNRFAKQLGDSLPPKVAMRLRAEKNRRNLFGLHAPASVLSDMVPEGRIAVDAGANAGLYTYWIARSASKVHAFEPHPRTFARLKASAPSNVVAHNVALSDVPGMGTLHVPIAGYGEASLIRRGVQIEEVSTTLRTLDSYELPDLGFLKIDVEGHEEALLRGAIETVNRYRPVVFVEAEERHNPGVVTRLSAFMTELGYLSNWYMSCGKFLPLSQFDLQQDQLQVAVSSPEYANNFLFAPS